MDCYAEIKLKKLGIWSKALGDGQKKRAIHKTALFIN
jgi:hypothetical protein